MTQTRGSIAGIGFAFIAMLLSLPVLASLSPSGLENLCRDVSLLGQILYFAWMIAVSVFAHLWVICWISGASMAAALWPVALLHALLVIPSVVLSYLSMVLLATTRFLPFILEPLRPLLVFAVGIGLFAVSMWLPKTASLSAVTVRGQGRITVAAIGLTGFAILFNAIMMLVGYFTCN